MVVLETHVDFYQSMDLHVAIPVDDADDDYDALTSILVQEDFVLIVYAKRF